MNPPVVRQRPGEFKILPDELARRYVARDGAELLDDADLWGRLAAEAHQVTQLEATRVFRQVVQQPPPDTRTAAQVLGRRIMVHARTRK